MTDNVSATCSCDLDLERKKDMTRENVLESLIFALKLIPILESVVQCGLIEAADVIG